MPQGDSHQLHPRTNGKQCCCVLPNEGALQVRTQTRLSDSTSLIFPPHLNVRIFITSVLYYIKILFISRFDFLTGQVKKQRYILCVLDIYVSVIFTTVLEICYFTSLSHSSLQLYKYKVTRYGFLTFVDRQCRPGKTAGELYLHVIFSMQIEYENQRRP